MFATPAVAQELGVLGHQDGVGMVEGASTSAGGTDGCVDGTGDLPGMGSGETRHGERWWWDELRVLSWRCYAAMLKSSHTAGGEMRMMVR